MAPPYIQPGFRRKKGVAYTISKLTGRLERWSGLDSRVPKKAGGVEKKKAAKTKPKQYRHAILDPSSAWRLKIGIDHGTKNSAACYALRDDGKPSTHGYDMKCLDTALASQFDFNIQSRVAVIKDHRSTTGKKWKLAFGSEINDNEMLALSGEILVVDLLKMALIDPKSSVWNLKKGNNMLRTIKSGHKIMLELLYRLNGRRHEVNVYSTLDQTVRVCTVDTLAVLAQEFLLYMKDQIQKSVMTRHSFTKKEADFVLQYKTDIALSVPTAWQDMDIDNIRVALNNAGYPETTKLLSEAKNSALFNVIWQLTDRRTQIQNAKQQRKKAEEFAKEWRDSILIIVDIGHGTSDLASIQILGTWPFVQVGEVVPGIGSACGAYWLNILFKTLLRKQYWDLILDLAEKSDISKEAVLEAFSTGFEETKRQFDTPQDTYHIAYKLPLDGGESIVERKFSISRKQMLALFSQWESEISQLIFTQIKKTREGGYGSSKIRVGLSGGGSHSKYLQESLKEKLSKENIDIGQFEPGNHPALAQGNLWALLDDSFSRQKFARTSYGVKANVPFDENLHRNLVLHARKTPFYGPSVRKEMPNRVVWAFMKDADISQDLPGITGHIKVDDNFDDIDLVQEVYSSQHDVVAMKTDYYNANAELESGNITKVGTINLPIGDFEAMGLEMKCDRQSQPYLNVAYRLEVIREGLLSMLRFTIPYGGEFSEDADDFEYGPRDKQATFYLKDLQAIEARLGDKGTVINKT